MLTAYQGWWSAQTAAFARTDSDTTQLALYSTGKALGDVLSSRSQLRANGLVMIGAPRNSPVVTALQPASAPATATVGDCLDVTGWHQADATTQAVRDPKPRLTRYPATASLRRADGRWIVFDFKREVGRTC